MSLRPITPVAASDTSSDGESLSDLDSGWTDLETSRSSNGRHSPSTISEAGDIDDTSSAIDQYDRETWTGLASERNEQQGIPDKGNDPVHVEPSAAPSSSAPKVPELSLEAWVADAVGSSLLSDDETETPHLSFYSSSSFLRLSFPDPLSNSGHDLLPSHALSRVQSRSTEGTHEVRSHSPTRTESLSSVTARSASATTPTDTSFSAPDEDDEPQEEAEYELPSVELAASAVSYALSIVLLGHPPLPPLKRSTLSTIIDMVATVLDGSPRILEGGDTARIHEVPIYARQPKSITGPEETSIHRIIIEDRTSGMSPSSSFTTLHCPTLALVFIQPPLSSPSLPSLPLNTRYIPLLLPSISDTSASSLLDFSQSVLFEHSVSGVPITDNAAMKSFALHQCKEMGIDGNRLDDPKGILTIEEFFVLSTDEISPALKELLFPSRKITKVELDKSPDSARASSVNLTFRKPIVFISAFLLALLFSLAVFIRGSPSVAPQDSRKTSPLPEEEKSWTFLHPLLNRTPNTQASSPDPTSTSSEHQPSGTPQSLTPASLRSFVESVFLPSAEEQAANAPTSPPLLSDRGKAKTKQDTGLRVKDNHQVRRATIDPVAPHLTINAPSSKSLSLLPQAQLSSRATGKGEEKAVDIVPEAQIPFPSTVTSISTRISNALAPLFDRVQTDIREILEALEALLQALGNLQRQTSHGLSGLAHVLSEHWQSGRGVQKFANKMHSAAKSVGEEASRRHARARYNARRIRDLSGRYVSAAQQQLKRSVERARGNAGALKSRVVSRRSKFTDDRVHQRAARAKKRARCVRKARCSEYVFESVMALVL